MGQMDAYRGRAASSRRRRGRVIRRKEMPLWQELPLLLVVAFCLAVLIRTFLVQAFFIPSGSMEDTLLSATGSWSTRSSTTCATRCAARSWCSAAPTTGRRR